MLKIDLFRYLRQKDQYEIDFTTVACDFKVCIAT